MEQKQKRPSVVVWWISTVVDLSDDDNVVIQDFRLPAAPAVDHDFQVAQLVDIGFNPCTPLARGPFETSRAA